MNNYPFKTNGVYVRNILPNSIEVYKPILDSNRFWYATNYKNNISSYEILWIDYFKGSRLNPPHLKARFDVKTGEIFSIVDSYSNNFTVSGVFDVTFDDETFKFGNDDFMVYGSLNEFDNNNPLDSLYVHIKKTNTELYLKTEGIYQNDRFRFIPFLK